MKKAIWMPVAAIMAAVVLTACFKKDDTVRCTPNTLQRDREIIDSFALENGLDLTWDNSDTGNVYFQIISEGSGSMPTLDSLVTFEIAGKTITGTKIVEEEVTDAKYSIRDYQNGILSYSLRKLKVGGTIKIVIPSSLNGLACNQGQTSSGAVIPPNSQFVYDITLTGVKENN